MSVHLPNLPSSSNSPKHSSQLAARTVRLASITAVVTVVGLVVLSLTSARAAAATGPILQLTGITTKHVYQAGQGVSLRWTVANSGPASCQASQIADGSIVITKVTRDGAPVEPALREVVYGDSLASAMGQQMATLGPGLRVAVRMDSTTMPVGSVPTDAVQTLESVSWSPSEQNIATLWPLGKTGSYVVSAVYALPSDPDLPLNACHGPSSPATVRFTITRTVHGFPVWRELILLVGILVALIFCTAFIRRRIIHKAVGRRVLSLVAISAFAATTAVLSIGEANAAQINVLNSPDKAFPGKVADCMKDFRSPPTEDDPGGGRVLQGIEQWQSKNKVSIVQRFDKGSNHTDVDPKNATNYDPKDPSNHNVGSDSAIHWDPYDTRPLSDGVARDPCSELYHELVHAYDAIRGKINYDYCDGTQIPVAEVKATIEEDGFRAHKHHSDQTIKPRRTWGGHTLPPKGLDACKNNIRRIGTGRSRSDDECSSASCASSNGDPHLTTFDGFRYDFQGVGEFVAVKSTADSLEVQTRQAPWFGSSDVSVNSAVAMNIRGDRLGFYVESNGITTRVNGSSRVFQDGMTRLAHGGTIIRSDTAGYLDGYQITWPDSSRAWISPVGSWGIKLGVALAANRRGQVVGLLGNFDTIPSNDLVSREGKQLAPSPLFHELYQVLGNSWRIHQAESLFDYTPGETTATFTDRRLPTRPVTSADLPNHDAAQAICHNLGVTDPTILQDCTLDVAVTGQLAFSDSAAATQAALTAGSLAGGSSIGQAGALAATLTPTARPTVFSVDRPGQTVRASFAGTAGQALDLGFSAVTLSGNQYYWVTVLAPNGSKLVDNSLLSDSDSLHLDPLAATGRYTVLVNPSSAGTGTITLTLSKRRA